MTDEQAKTFAKHWLQAWNAHDLEAVLSHYAEDFTMSSPLIAAMGLDPAGTLCGKAAVGAYWHAALERLPDLAFESIAVLAGASSVVIHYRTSFGKLAAEAFFFAPDGLVERAAAHYGVA